MRKTTFVLLAVAACAIALSSCANKKQAYAPAPMAPEVVHYK